MSVFMHSFKVRVFIIVYVSILRSFSGCADCDEQSSSSDLSVKLHSSSTTFSLPYLFLASVIFDELVKTSQSSTFSDYDRDDMM